LIIKYKAIAKRIETGQELLTNSPMKANTPGIESIKKIEYDKRRFSNPSSKGHSASKSPIQIKHQRPDSREWNFSTIVSTKNDLREAPHTMQNSRTLLH